MAIPNLQDVQILSSEWVRKIADRLTHLRDDDAKLVADNGRVQYSSRRFNVEVEDFQVAGLSTRRYKYKDIDCFAEYPYKYTAQSKRYDRLTSQLAPKKPSKELIHWVMADILHKNDGKLGGRTMNLMKTAYVSASRVLRKSRAKWPEMEKELKAQIENKDFRRWWDDMQATKINRFKDQYRQSDQDAAAAGDPNILELVLVLDKNNQLIAFRASKAMQKIFSEGVLEKVYVCFDVFTYHQAIPKPDHVRHLLQVEFLRDNPRIDCRAAEDVHLAKCGSEHYGCREAIEDTHGRNIYASDGSHLGRHWYTYYMDRLYRELQPGPWRVLTEACAFFKRLLPDLYEDYVDVCQALDKSIRMDTKPEGEPFHLRALLINLSSVDHCDTKDCRYGIAALTPFGDFEGAGLMLRQLGLRMVFPSGSVLLIRGHELNHSTTEWSKTSRFCVVHTAHEAVRARAYRKLNRPYLPTALAPNFTTEANERRQTRASKKSKTTTGSTSLGRDISKNPISDGSQLQNAEAETSGQGDPPVDPATTQPDEDDTEDSDYSSDTDISCRDLLARAEWPNVEVNRYEEDYSTVGVTIRPKKRKRSDKTNSNEDEEEETSSDE